MATPDYSIGFTRSEVEDILTIHKGELKKTLISWADSGSNATRREIAEINLVISACQQALRKLAPDVYGHPRRISQSSISYLPR